MLSMRSPIPLSYLKHFHKNQANYDLHEVMGLTRFSYLKSSRLQPLLSEIPAHDVKHEVMDLPSLRPKAREKIRKIDWWTVISVRIEPI